LKYNFEAFINQFIYIFFNFVHMGNNSEQLNCDMNCLFIQYRPIDSTSRHLNNYQPNSEQRRVNFLSAGLIIREEFNIILIILYFPVKCTL
jgi:hypothetical protein